MDDILAGLHFLPFIDLIVAPRATSDKFFDGLLWLVAIVDLRRSTSVMEDMLQPLARQHMSQERVFEFPRIASVPFYSSGRGRAVVVAGGAGKGGDEMGAQCRRVGHQWFCAGWSLGGHLLCIHPHAIQG